MSPKSVVFTGCQPSGGGQGLHLGNYIGALLPFLKMQRDTSLFERLYFCIVDLHALTSSSSSSPLDRDTVYSRSELLFATALACGIDPARTTLYCQSDVGAHAELFWLLSCRTPVHLLNTMTQWKEKKRQQHGDSQSNTGLYTYPVLMAADILLFRASHVPVGDDQLQHLELTRKLVDSFNAHYGLQLFQRPTAVLNQQQKYPVSRIMDLRNAAAKMSKSAPSNMGRINLSDTADEIAQKIRKAKTDSLHGISYLPEERPELANLLHIYSALSDVDPPAIAAEFETADFGTFKEKLIDLLVATIQPIATKTAHYLSGDRQELHLQMKHGADLANQVALPHLAYYKSVILGKPFVPN